MSQLFLFYFFIQLQKQASILNRQTETDRTLNRKPDRLTERHLAMMQEGPRTKVAWARGPAGHWSPP